MFGSNISRIPFPDLCRVKKGSVISTYFRRVYTNVLIWNGPKVHRLLKKIVYCLCGSTFSLKK